MALSAILPQAVSLPLASSVIYWRRILQMVGWEREETQVSASALLPCCALSACSCEVQSLKVLIQVWGLGWMFCYITSDSSRHKHNLHLIWQVRTEVNACSMSGSQSKYTKWECTGRATRHHTGFLSMNLAASLRLSLTHCLQVPAKGPNSQPLPFESLLTQTYCLPPPLGRESCQLSPEPEWPLLWRPPEGNTTSSIIPLSIL